MLLIIAHLPSRVLEEGVLIAAREFGVPICLLTDCIYDHQVRIQECGKNTYSGCRLLECDVANPVAVSKLLAIHQFDISAVIALDAGLQSCAALVAEQTGIAQPGGWQSAMQCEHNYLSQAQADGRRVLNASGSVKELFLESFDYPVIARPIERGGRRYERLLGSSAELGRYLEDVGGYVFVEPHSNSELYALDLLYNGSDFHILCGSHFHQVENEQPNPRARSFIRRPPFCDRIINEIATLKPSIGRYYVEYHVTGDAVMIREINNGYYDGDSELAVAALLTGDLFRAQLQLCLGQPREPLAQQFVGEFEWLTVADDKEPFDQLLTHNYRAIFRPGRNGEPGWLSVCGPDQQQAQALFYELRNRITQPEDRAASPRHSEVMA